jgi:hypothetical protein
LARWYAADDDEYEDDPEPVELPTVSIYPPARCCICRRPGQSLGCFRCGKPVCYNEKDYQRDSHCGGWILDWWHNSAYDYDDGNEFYCRKCLQKAYAFDNRTRRAYLFLNGRAIAREQKKDYFKGTVAHPHKRHRHATAPRSTYSPLWGDLGDLEDHPF